MTRRHTSNQTVLRTLATSIAINLLRMVKLFGWEQNMAERVNEKRSEELAWIRKSKVCDPTIASSLGDLPNFPAFSCVERNYEVRPSYHLSRRTLSTRTALLSRA